MKTVFLSLIALISLSTLTAQADDSHYLEQLPENSLIQITLPATAITAFSKSQDLKPSSKTEFSCEYRFTPSNSDRTITSGTILSILTTEVKEDETRYFINGTLSINGVVRTDVSLKCNAPNNSATIGEFRKYLKLINGTLDVATPVLF
jgi:hypothetical protein